jgi:predicted dehydrogenase
MKQIPKSQLKQTPRRTFLKTGALAAGSVLGAPMILKSEVLGNAMKASANSRIGVGFFGYGLIMRGHVGAFSTMKETQPIALCDVRKNHLESGLKAIKEKAEVDAIGTGRWEEIVDNKDIDIVVIGTPDHWHAALAIASMKAGKDVYVEKPMTLTIEEGKAMVKAQEKYKRILQVGSQQRSERAFRAAANIVRNGWIGDIEKIYCSLGSFPQPPKEENIVPVPEGFDYDRWLGPTPFYEYSENRVKGNYSGGWRCYWDYGGRKFGDWGAHHFDIVQWALDKDESGPVEFIPKGYEGAEHHHFRYENGPTVYRDRKPSEDEKMEGVRGHMIWFFGSKGKLGVSRGGKINVDPDKYTRHQFTEKESIVYESTNHRGNFLDCVKSRKPTICHAGVGHRTATVCHLAAIAERTGKVVKWDPKKEQVVGDAEVAKMQDRPRRKGYELPTV